MAKPTRAKAEGGLKQPSAGSEDLDKKRMELNLRLYSLANDPQKVEEFEAVRLELAALDGGARG